MTTFDELKKSVKGRLFNEINKLIKLRDQYGLTNQGHAELHALVYCLTGELVDTGSVKRIEEEDLVKYE